MLVSEYATPKKEKLSSKPSKLLKQVANDLKTVLKNKNIRFDMDRWVYTEDTWHYSTCHVCVAGAVPSGPGDPAG